MLNFVANICTALSFFAVLSVTASASSIPAGTYALTNVVVGSSPLNGTLSLDANGMATAASFTYANTSDGSPTFSTISSTGTSGNNPLADFVYLSGSNGQVVLYYFATLNSSGGINLCEAGSGCTQASYLHLYSPNYQGDLTGGSLAASAASPAASATVTPEPASWTLVLTGVTLVAAVVVLRRRPRQRFATYMP